MDRNLVNILTGMFLIAGLYIIFQSNLGWQYYLGLLIIVSFLQGLLARSIPQKKKNKKTTKNNSTTKNPRNNETSSTSKNLTDKELLLADIESLSGSDFERLVYLYFQDKGFKPETTPITGDHGVDLVIQDPKDGFKIAVQCKRYKSENGIGNGDLIKLEGGKRFYKCQGTLFITTSYFTHKAKEFAQTVRMDTWNGLQVLEKIDKWRKQKVKRSS